MGRYFAGILGPLAMLTTLARAGLAGHSVEAALWQAWWGLVIYAPVGFVVGGIADRVVEESVGDLVERELAERKREGEGPTEAAESPQEPQVAASP